MKILSALIMGLVMLMVQCVDYTDEVSVAPEDCIYCPEPPTLLYPENNETCEPGVILNDSLAILELQWTKTKNTDYYDITLIDNESGELQTFSSSNISQEVVLLRAKSYSWNVMSYNARSDSYAESDNYQFYLEGIQVKNVAPTAPTLLTPESGKTISAGEVLFSWSASTDPDGDSLLYTLYLDTVDGYQEPPISQVGLAGTGISRTLEAGQQYYFRVEVSDGLISASSEIRSFRTN